MAKLYVDTIEPEGGTTNLAIGESGQDVILPGNDIRANVLQDAGGNAIFTSNGSGTLSGVSGGFGGPLALISSQAVTNQASITFTSGITSAYDHYLFRFYMMNPATDNVTFYFYGSTNGGSSYGITKTTTFGPYANVDAANTSNSNYGYHSGKDVRSGTGPHWLSYGLGNATNECLSGELHIFDVASTSLVKNFYAVTGEWLYFNYADINYTAGYFDTTTALNAFKFAMSSGNMDGTIKMYGVK